MLLSHGTSRLIDLFRCLSPPSQTYFQAALSDRDRGWFLGGLCRLASAMPPSHGVVGMRMLLDPITAAATPANLSSTHSAIREFVADSFAKALSTFRPLQGPASLVAVVEGYR